MVVVEPVGTGLAIGGILLSFKGAVDGYLLLASIFASDNGLSFASSRYHIESLKLNLWGERFAISDPTNCLLLKEPQPIRDAVARILAEIKNTHYEAIVFVSKYEMKETDVPRGGGVGEEFEKDSLWIKRVWEERQKLKQTGRFKWAVKDKDAFMELIRRLETLNKNLWEVVRTDESDAVRIVTGVLAGLSKQFDLGQLQQQVKGSPENLLALAAKLKEVQEQDVSTAAKGVNQVPTETLKLLCDDKATNGRYLGFYQPKDQVVERVWVDWKHVSKTNPAKDQIVTRIYALGALLTSSNAEEFHRPTCLGVFDDKKFEGNTKGDRRIAFVYRLPGSVDEIPISLLALLKESKKAHTRPALGDRFEMAYKLASAISLFHATNWLHKSFRSDNILFANRSSINEPQISGFQYSRPSADTSLETYLIGVPELDLYYHPEVTKGWSKVKDIYSLGVVLIEIAFWRPLFEEKLRKMDIDQVSGAILKDLNGKFGTDLIGMVGKVFVDVIKVCLTGSFGVKSGDSEEESKRLSNEFFLKVVKPLESCKA
jgi:hypothetical protein